MSSNISSVIKSIREQRGMSQNQLAKHSGLSQSAISSIESTTKSPSLDSVFKIAKALNVPIIELLGFASITETEKPTVKDDGLRSEVNDMLIDLPPADLQLVSDFVSWLKAIRTEDATRQE